MSERSLDLLAQLGGIDEKYIDEAGEDVPAKKKIHWLRWTALAACLAVVIVGGGILTGVIPGLPIGGNAGGSGVDPAAEGPSTFMSYAGPVFPLTLREENDAITAGRNVTLDFSPWVREWCSNEDEANSREGLTEEERREVLDDYNEWFPEGGRWISSSDILVTDAYTLTNTSDEDQNLTVLYPFAGALTTLGVYRPALTADGKTLETTLYAGEYVGGYMGGVGGDLVTPVEEGSLNLARPGNWEDYRDALAGGTYLQNALGAYPDLSGTTAIVYEFTDLWANGKNEKAGDPRPNIKLTFWQDTERSRVLTTGSEGGSWNWETGEMERWLTIPEERDGRGDRLIVVGEDIQDLTLQGYVTTGRDGWQPVEGGATINKYEIDLESILRQAAGELFDSWDGDNSAAVEFEMFYGLFKEWIITDGPLADSGAMRYDIGQLEENEVLGHDRVFWLEAEVTVPAGGSVELTASMRKAGSYDFYCTHTKNQGVYGYDLTTRLGSNLNCTAQTATLEDRGQIEIVRQNYGFDLENGVKTVPLTEEEYYLEVKRPPEG